MKFSIIIPAYNSANFIKIPLDSLERQNYKNKFEVLIINDGSTDNLKDIVKPYLERNKSWKLINKKNGNWGSVINYVKSKKISSGEYITILDSDDFFKESTLNEVAKRSEDIVITKIAKLENGKEKNMPVFFSRTNIVNKNRAFTPVSTPHGKFYKKELFESVVDLKEGYSYQDTVLYNDLASKAKTIYYINKPLAVWWRDREGNSTSKKWDTYRANLWLETCERVINLSNIHNESNAWALMYLWELDRNYKGKIPFKIKVDTTKFKFSWLPFGFRKIAKIYFKFKTRRYRK